MTQDIENLSNYALHDAASAAMEKPPVAPSPYGTRSPRRWWTAGERAWFPCWPADAIALMFNRLDECGKRAAVEDMGKRESEQRFLASCGTGADMLIVYGPDVLTAMARLIVAAKARVE